MDEYCKLLKQGSYSITKIVFLSFFLSLSLSLWCGSRQWARVSSFTRFLDHTQRRTTVDRTPLDEWSARRRDLYLTTHNTHNWQTSPGEIRTHNLSRRAAADLRLRPRRHWARKLPALTSVYRTHMFYFTTDISRQKSNS